MTNPPNTKNRVHDSYLSKALLGLAVCTVVFAVARAARAEAAPFADAGSVASPVDVASGGDDAIPDAGVASDDAATAAPGVEPDAGAGAAAPDQSAVVGAAPVEGPVEATPSDAGSPDELGAVVVTGVRGSRPGSVATSPTPIDVIGAEEIKNTGRVGLKEILGAIVPSFDMPALAGGGTSASVKPYSLRGLSGDYLLVLVNGKRRHTTALINNLSNISGGSTPVDLDLLPAPAIGRIELLRDGAAAQYGSDAISAS
jgi:hypothetical protein